MAKKVLIADDDSDVRLFVRAIMENAGWEAEEAANGEDAMDLALELLPDLVILDVTMPKLDGFEVFRRLRKSHTAADIPIIMLTGINAEGSGIRYTAEDMERAFEVDRPEGFVDKPVDSTFLMHTVMGVVG